MNIGRYTKEYSEHLTMKRYARSTIDTYCKCLYNFLHHHRDVATKPSEISQDRIIEYLKGSKSESTLKQRIGALKRFYSHVVRQPLKFKYIEYPRKSKRLPVPLSLNEVQRIFDAVANLKHRAILVTLYSTGLRISELLNLKVHGDIDSDAGVIWIKGGKGNKDRHVPLDDSALNLLRSYWKVYKPSEYLFEGPGGKYSPTSVRNILHRACDKAGVRRIHPHLLRHSFGTHTIEAGHDISILQKMLGHRSILSTRIYTHISPAIIARAGSPVKSLTI